MQPAERNVQDLLGRGGELGDAHHQVHDLDDVGVGAHRAGLLRPRQQRLTGGVERGAAFAGDVGDLSRGC